MMVTRIIEASEVIEIGQCVRWDRFVSLLEDKGECGQISRKMGIYRKSKGAEMVS